jgi:hypothetical protein
MVAQKQEFLGPGYVQSFFKKGCKPNRIDPGLRDAFWTTVSLTLILVLIGWTTGLIAGCLLAAKNGTSKHNQRSDEQERIEKQQVNPNVTFTGASDPCIHQVLVSCISEPCDRKERKPTRTAPQPGRG